MMFSCLFFLNSMKNCLMTDDVMTYFVQEALALYRLGSPVICRIGK